MIFLFIIIEIINQNQIVGGIVRDALDNRHDESFGRVNADKLSTRRNEHVALLAWKQEPFTNDDDDRLVRRSKQPIRRPIGHAPPKPSKVIPFFS